MLKTSAVSKNLRGLVGIIASCFTVATLQISLDPLLPREEKKFVIAQSIASFLESTTCIQEWSLMNKGEMNHLTFTNRKRP